MQHFVCTSRNQFGATVTTHHVVLDLALYEFAVRKAQGHTEAKVEPIEEPIAIVNPGDVPERSRPPVKLKPLRESYKKSNAPSMRGGGAE